MKAEILNIAKECRQWAETQVAQNELYFDEDLGCFCAIGSSYLSKKLEEKGISHQIAVFEGMFSHCFVVTDDYVVDITATQFNSPLIREKNEGKGLTGVEVRSHDDIDTKYFDFWEISKVFSNHEQLLAYQKEKNWPESQRLDGHPDLKNLFISIYD